MTINNDNLIELIEKFKLKNNINNLDLAYILENQVSHIEKILKNPQEANDEFLKQFAILFQIGIKNYKKLSKSDREKISEKIGAVAISGISLGSIATIISSVGITGLSGAGIMSGLATIGGIIGGGSVIGITMVAAIPIAAGALGYFGVKGINKIRKKQRSKL